jgi:alpha-galactosidase
MKIRRLFSLTLTTFAVLGSLAGCAKRPSPTAARNIQRGCLDDWFGPGAAKRPFSFNYGGRASVELLPGWNCAVRTRTLDTHRLERTLTYADPASKLEVRCVVVEYLDYPAVEWVLYFKNNGSADTPILESILPLNTTLSSAAAGQPTLYYADGSHVLVADFQPRQSAITSTTTTLSSLGGRSSDGTLSFFNLAQTDGTGVVIGVGWTGQWIAHFTTVGDTKVNAQAGMEFNHFKLHPNEEVRTPAALLLFWTGGERVKGQNQFRRLLLAHYTPAPGGAPLVPPICASPYGVMSLEATSEATMLQGISNLAAHDVPVDVWWMDAGWYPCDGTWVKTGTWQPDPVRFPRGLRPVADAAHSNGMKFLLWFEPERAMLGTQLYNEHPEWLIGPIAGSGLLNLGNPAALAWAKSTFAGLIRSVGIDIYRQDLNGNDPMVYWKTVDTPDRLGMTEIKYIMGLYEYFDYLLAQNPKLLIDNCSSGGRRIDFEMLRRSVVMTRSDYTESIGLQCQTYGLSQWVPLTGYGSTLADDYNFRSGLGSFTTVSFDWYNNPGVWESVYRMLNQYSQYKSVKELFTGDFFPLSPYSTAADAWIAWQYDRPDLGEGLVQVFRRSDSQTTNTIYKLFGLEPVAQYSVSNLDSGASFTRTGASLLRDGLAVSLPSKPGSAMLRYKRLN